MKWYKFHQNNSGGWFHGPAIDIFVQAENVERAAEIAETEAEIYFNGCATGYDCSCCGDRWSMPYNEGYEDKPEVDEWYRDSARRDGLEFVAMYIDKDMQKEHVRA